MNAPKSISHFTPSTPLAAGVVYEALGFIYGEAGRLASMVDSDGGAATYEYEAANRLNQTVGNGELTAIDYRRARRMAN